MKFGYMHPDKIQIGTLIKNPVLNSTYKVVGILCRDIDFDGKSFVCGYMENDKGLRMSFAHKEDSINLYFFNPNINMKSKLGNVSKLPNRATHAQIAKKRNHERTIEELYCVC